MPDGARRIHVDRTQPGALLDALEPHRDDFDVVFDNTAYTPTDLEPMVELFARPRAALRVHQLGRGLQAQLRPAGQRGLRPPRARRRRPAQGVRRRQGAAARTTWRSHRRTAPCTVAAGHPHDRARRARSPAGSRVFSASSSRGGRSSCPPRASRSCTSCTCRTSPT